MPEPTEHAEAISKLKASGLPGDECQELFELYQEDLEEHSEHTALEKLDNGITDAKSD